MCTASQDTKRNASPNQPTNTYETFLILILSNLLDSTKASRTTSTNQTNLSTGRTILGNRRGHTNMLMVTTTVRMLHRILGNTTNLGPTVTLDGILVIGTSSLQEGLVGTTTAGNDTNLSTSCTGNRLLSSRRKTQTSRSLIFIVRHQDSKGSTGTSKGTTISRLGFNVTNNGTFWKSLERKHVANGQRCLLSTIHKLSRIHSFRTKHEFVILLVTVRIVELNFCDRCTTTRIVQNFLHDSTDISLFLGIIQSTKFHSTLASTTMRLENAGFTTTLCLKKLRKRVLVPMHYPRYNQTINMASQR
mmetsp:Transcript_44137/g.65458  ORF Transcript_44137/g.65458 Transcript_44137/m.65458 type:complete len:304 (+) Transcript_44137:59-970(+)